MTPKLIPVRSARGSIGEIQFNDTHEHVALVE